jgi:hypothetical protein
VAQHQTADRYLGDGIFERRAVYQRDFAFLVPNDVFAGPLVYRLARAETPVSLAADASSRRIASLVHNGAV